MVFKLFPKMKRSAPCGPHSGSELSADFSSSMRLSHLAHVDPWPYVWNDEAGLSGSSRAWGSARVTSSWGSWGAAASSWLLGGERGTCECVFLVYPLRQRQAEQSLAFSLFQARRCAKTGARVVFS